jgi:cyclic beta-1,2-glucan synthetase
MTASPGPRLTNNSMAQLPLDEKVQSEFGNVVAASEEEHIGLLDHARNQARAWVVDGRSAGNRSLKAELRKIAGLLRQIKKDTARGGGATAMQESVQLLLASGRLLLQSACLDAEDALEGEGALPQVSWTAGGSRARCYAAAKSYLDAVEDDFEEDTFRAYLQAVQESGAFEMAELWQLSPILQLNLLIQLGEEVEHAREGKRADVEERVGKILAALDHIRKASWKKTFQILSLTDAILCGDPAGAYPNMDFRSCNSYRAAVEQLARFANKPEEEVARTAVSMATAARQKFPLLSRQGQRHSHVGYYLVDKGRVLLEREIAYRPQGMAFVRAVLLEAPELFYFLGVEFCLFAIMMFILSGIPVGVPFIAATLLFLLPVSEAAIEVINPFILFLLPPRVLPRLDFSHGIPEDCLTVVAVPTLLISKEQVRDLVRTLEIRYLGNVDPNLCFALLTDPPDSALPFDEKDQLVSYCAGLIQALNAKYGKDGSGPFFHLHRNRTFNETEQTWMGWERKRGKLLDFNEFLRGSEDRFPVKVGNITLLQKVRYVITLDSDTQLPRDSARRLVAAMAHPLNQALIDPITNTVRHGYGVLQPRVGISVNSVHRSRLAFIYSGQTGLDIYTNAVSDVYQDLFAEGIFTGKGIYEVDVFRKVLSGRFPSNAILSHDLIEGAYSRTGLVTEVEIIDDYPSHFSAHSRRKHRWVRGDWQILRWLWPKVPDSKNEVLRNPLSFLSRWKILDNLRRSVIEAATFLLFLSCWFVLPGSAARWTIAALALLLIPSYVQGMLALLPLWKSAHKWAVVTQAIDNFVTSQINVLVFLAFLPHQTLVTLDAIIRTVFRLAISRRKLLEWETAAQSEVEKKGKTPVDVYLQFTPLVSVAIAAALYFLRPSSLLVASPILLLWFLSRAAAKWLDRPLRSAKSVLKNKEEAYARKIALKTWRFFHEYSNEEQNWLIPDNIQGEEESVAARISTTNLGILFNAQYAAYHLGILTLPCFACTAERTMATTKKLQRFHGQLVNWYDTKTLAPLEPLFISSVDNGNLACCLWTLKQGCLSALAEPIFSPATFQSLADHLELSVEAMRKEEFHAESVSRLEQARLEANSLASDIRLWMLAATLVGQSLDEALRDPAAQKSREAAWWLRASQAKIRDLLSLGESFAPWLFDQERPLFKNNSGLYDSTFLGSLTLANYRERIAESFPEATVDGSSDAQAGWTGVFGKVELLRGQLQRIACDADTLADDMNFALFYDDKRKALSVGYDAAQGRLQGSFYDLLASEARSAVFVAIAKNDIPQEAWFHMGRTHTRYARRNVLISWTGTMFEYLMPALWLKYFPSTLLENSLRSAVACQKAYVRRYKIPWGISEGACSAKNDAGHFEYHAFGVPPLALKANLPHKLVITPYACALALTTNPREAMENLLAMDSLGWNGRYGFYESAEFAKASVVRKGSFQVVHTWMAHHQGMILLSVCNLLSNSVLQRLFHEEVRVAATERILHELPLSPQALQLVTDSPAEIGATAA